MRCNSVELTIPIEVATGNEVVPVAVSAPSTFKSPDTIAPKLDVRIFSTPPQLIRVMLSASSLTYLDPAKASGAIYLKASTPPSISAIFAAP